MTLKLTQERTLHTPRYVRASCVKNLRRVNAGLSWLMELTGRERQTEECGCSCDCDGRERPVKFQHDEIRRRAMSQICRSVYDSRSQIVIAAAVVCDIVFDKHAAARR